jgi:preprotein translocase subunit YajC
MTYALVDLASYYPTNIGYRTASSIIYYLDDCDVLIPSGCTYYEVIKPDTLQTGSLTNDGTVTINGGAEGLNDVINNGTLLVTGGGINGDITNTGTWNYVTVAFRMYGDSITNSGTMNLRFLAYSDLSFYGDINFDSFGLDSSGRPFTFTFEHGQTYTYNNLTISGIAGQVNTIKSDSVGNRFSFDGGALTLEYVDVADSESDTSDITCYHSTQSNTDYREASPHFIFAKDITAFVTEHN